MRCIALTTVALSVLAFVSQSVSALPVRDSYSELSGISKRGPSTNDGSVSIDGASGSSYGSEGALAGTIVHVPTYAGVAATPPQQGDSVIIGLVHDLPFVLGSDSQEQPFGGLFGAPIALEP